MSRVSKILRARVRKQVRSIAAFVQVAAKQSRDRIALQEGLMFEVTRSRDGLELRDFKEREGRRDHLHGFIHVGGEMCNSWTTNYELHTFMSALLLAAAATALREKFETYMQLGKEEGLERIERDLLDLDETTLERCFRYPVYGILSQFVDDVEGDRYAKAHLWGIQGEYARRFVSSIPGDVLHVPAGIEPTELFDDVDIQIARDSLKDAEGLFDAKAFQMHRSIGRFLETFDINIDHIPLFFSSTPNLHIGALPDYHPFFKLLWDIARNRRKPKTGTYSDQPYPATYARAVSESKPWLFKTACPCCGIGSKYTLKSRIDAKGETATMTCRPVEKEIKNEVGWHTQTLEGCGHQWTRTIPHKTCDCCAFDGPQEFARLLKAQDVGMHFPANMGVMMMLSGVPVVGSMFEDPGLVYDGSGLVGVEGPTGDSPQMIMSVMATQLAIASGRLGGIEPGLLSSSIPLMMAQSPQFMDPDVMQEGISYGTTNSSVASIMRRMDPLDILDQTLTLTHYPIHTIGKYRRRFELGAMISEAKGRGIFVP